MSVEYATTFVEVLKTGPYDEFAASEYGYRYDPGVVHCDEAELKPVPPVGDGWTMCGSAATPERLYWFWQRKKSCPRPPAKPPRALK